MDKDRLDALLGGAIYGLTLSTAGSSATFGISAGGASGMSLASAYTKTTSAWTVGSGNGSLDTGAIANSTWYHVFAIERIDTSPTVTDVLVSLSASAPTMPTNYTRKRLIGSMKTDGSAHWTKFLQYGDVFYLDVMTKDANGTFVSTAAILATLNTPPRQLEAIFNLQLDAVSNNDAHIVTCPDQTDTAVSSNAETTQAGAGTAGAAIRVVNQLRCMTNTSSQVRLRPGLGTSTYVFYTVGWVDTRGR